MDSANFIYSNPLFLNPTQGVGINYDGSTSNWNVLDSSIAINNGYHKADTLALIDTDFNGNPRIVNTIDIGAYENQQEDITNILEKINRSNSLNIFPNPTIDIITIDINYKSEEKSTLVITDLNGAIINTTPIKLNNKKNKLQADLTYLPPGIYIIQLLDGSKIIAKQSIIKTDEH